MKVTPASFQVNEGDSLTTSLTGFAPGSTLYFKVIGKGVSKKDFIAGGIKGSLKVGADGAASISHRLLTDKTTEGDESFSIEVFSDKKMRNLLGRSDAVTVFDTSAKAVKTAKGGGNTKSGAPKSNSLSFKDPLTGQLLQSDQVYNGFFNTRSYASWENGKYEIEASNSTIVLTQYLDGWRGNATQKPSRIDVSRSVIKGDFKVDKNRNLAGTAKTITNFSVQHDPNANYLMESASSFSLRNGTKITNSLFSDRSPTIQNASYFYNNLERLGNIVDKFPSTPYYSDRKQIQGLADASFFPEGWWQDPFLPNLA